MSILNGPTKLIAMFPFGAQKQMVKPTFERFVEDRLAELELSHDDLAKQMGSLLGMEYKIHRLTRRINSPETFPANELAAFAEALNVKDISNLLIKGFSAGVDGCTYRQLNQFAVKDGRFFDLVEHAA